GGIPKKANIKKKTKTISGTEINLSVRVIARGFSHAPAAAAALAATAPISTPPQYIFNNCRSKETECPS
ncbi:hypothetical protein J7K05_01455, partial [bacterium]|nr:hypothetical protein [bacterium]